MRKRVKIYALILLALCLAVPAVNAYTITNPSNNGVYNIGDADSVTVIINQGYMSMQWIYGYGIDGTVYNFDNVIYPPSTITIPLPSDKSSCNVGIIGGNQQIQRFGISFTVNYNYQEPIPEGPYLSSTVLSESASGITYQIKPMPDDGTYLFSRVNTGNPSAVDSTIIYSSEDAAINYKINRGTSQTFYCNYKEGYWGLPQSMSLTLSAPLYSEDVLINATIINNTLQNLPNPVKPSENNPIRSGDFQPIGKNAIINSPFGNLVTNGGIIFSLPHMESPQQLRENLLNGTGNLTAPLYDAVDSIAGAVLFVPSVISGAVSSVVSPLLETVDVLKSVFDSLFEVIKGSMDFIYYLLPTVYLLIPDAVWWCVIAVLCYFIFKWILIFVFGNDVINAYFEKGGKE